MAGFEQQHLADQGALAVAYGANAHLLVIAAQDTGVAIQSKANSPIFNAIQAGDGANAVVSDKTPGMSIYYTSSQNLGGLSRLIIGSNGQQISPGDPNVSPNGVLIQCSLAGSGKYDYCQNTVAGASANFTSPFVLNRVDPTLIALAGTTLYTTQDNSPAIQKV